MLNNVVDKVLNFVILNLSFLYGKIAKFNYLRLAKNKKFPHFFENNKKEIRNIKNLISKIL